MPNRCCSLLSLGLGCLLLLAAPPAPAAPPDWFAEAKAAMAEQQWKHAIEILDAVLRDEPELLNARRLRALCYREKARRVFDTLRAHYFLSPSQLVEYWHAAQHYALGQTIHLDRGGDYDVTKALFDFEFILARDSTFHDVLFQYTRLWHEHEVFDRAIALAEAQLRFRPDMPEAHVVLVRAYRQYVAWTRPRKALAWLRDHLTPYAAYFIGEVYRRDGQLDRADMLFAELLSRPLQIPAQPVLLSRARVDIARGQYEQGYRFIEQALRLHTLAEAKLLFEDFKYVFTEEEYRAYPFLQTAAQYEAFYRRMWTQRNPVPASRINWRLVEHYRRLVVAERDYEYYGARNWFNSADEGKELDYPPMFSLNHEFNDRGLIYIRHGEPDERVLNVQVPNESWRYREAGLDFHFMVNPETATGNNWRLTPAFTDCATLEKLRHWGGYYVQLACPIGVNPDPRNEFDLIEGRIRMADASRAFVMEGLTTDRQTWTDAVEPFDFPFDLFAFRDPDGRTDLRLYYALPIGRFSQAIDTDTIRVEVGVALHDTVWTPVMTQADTLRYRPTDDPKAPSIREMRFAVPPDSYHVALHSDLLDSPLLAGYRFDRRLPDFREARTMMSDVVLAYAILPRTGQEPTSRDDLQIVANPFHRFALDQPVHVYFEVYHLALDAEDRAHYRVEYALEPRQAGGVLGLFRRKGTSLSVTTRFESATPSPLVFTEIDVGKVPAGDYVLVVRVTDELTGAEMEQRVPVELHRQ